MAATKEDFVAQEAFKRLDAIGAQISELAPVVWSKMVLLTQAESIAYLAVGAICLLAAISGTFFGMRIFANWNKSRSGRYGEVAPLHFWVSVFFMAGYIPAAVNLLYPWNWVGAFAPEARLIARLIGAITQTTS